MAVIKNVEINWVKCDQDHPDMGYDGDSPSWNITVPNPPEDALKVWKENKLGGLKTDKEGNEYLVIKRKAAPFANGDQKDAPVVVDGHLRPLDPNLIGNGSLANIQYSVYPWKYRNKSGKAADLMGVQIVNLVQREGTAIEFEVIEDAPADPEEVSGVDDDDVY